MNAAAENGWMTTVQLFGGLNHGNGPEPTQRGRCPGFVKTVIEDDEWNAELMRNMLRTDRGSHVRTFDCTGAA